MLKNELHLNTKYNFDHQITLRVNVSVHTFFKACSSIEDSRSVIILSDAPTCGIINNRHIFKVQAREGQHASEVRLVKQFYLP